MVPDWFEKKSVVPFGIGGTLRFNVGDELLAATSRRCSEMYGNGGRGLGVAAGAGGLGAGLATTGFPIVGLALVGLAAIVVGLALVRLAVISRTRP
jgi:hypothetical protein